MLSRLKCKGESDAEDGAAVFQISLIEQLPLRASDIAKENRHDLSKVMHLTLGWPAHVSDPNLHPHTERKTNSQQIKDVYCGDPEWWCCPSTGRTYSQNYMRVIRESLT